MWRLPAYASHWRAAARARKCRAWRDRCVEWHHRRCCIRAHILRWHGSGQHRFVCAQQHGGACVLNAAAGAISDAHADIYTDAVSDRDCNIICEQHSNLYSNIYRHTYFYIHTQ